MGYGSARILDSVKGFIKNEPVNVKKSDDTLGRTALSRAATDGFLHVVEYLLEVWGIDVNSTSPSGRTPLPYAASYGRLEVARVFVADERVGIHLVDSLGQRPWGGRQNAVIRALFKSLKKLEG